MALGQAAEPRQRITLAGAVEAVVLGAVVYYAVLALASVAQGHSALYPFRVVTAIFNGNRALPEYGPYFELGTARSVVGGSFWILFLSALCVVTFVPLVRRRGLGAAALTGAAVAWSVLWLVGTLVLLGGEVGPGVRRMVSSFEGVREIGHFAFFIAHVVFGLVVAACLSRRRPEKRSQQLEPDQDFQPLPPASA